MNRRELGRKSLAIVAGWSAMLTLPVKGKAEFTEQITNTDFDQLIEALKVEDQIEFSLDRICPSYEKSMEANGINLNEGSMQKAYIKAREKFNKERPRLKVAMLAQYKKHCEAVFSKDELSMIVRFLDTPSGHKLRSFLSHGSMVDFYSLPWAKFDKALKESLSEQPKA